MIERDEKQTGQEAERPSVGESFEECMHRPTSPRRHRHSIDWWQVDGNWIALCEKCHVDFMIRGKVRISVGKKRITQPLELLTEGRN